MRLISLTKIHVNIMTAKIISTFLQPVHITPRLKIMRELFEETGDERFRLMPCLYQPYRDDTVLQIAHLIENEQRAEMCFWD